MRRALLAAAILAAACGPATAGEPAPAETSTSTSTTEPAPVLTEQDVRFIVAEITREEAVGRFLRHVDAVKRAIPPKLRVMAWCEGGRYLGLPRFTTNYLALNQQGSSASGGYQILDSTWRTWRTFVDGAEVYARAVHAPEWVQDEVATAAFHREGSTPWNASAGCWAPLT